MQKQGWQLHRIENRVARFFPKISHQNTQKNYRITEFEKNMRFLRLFRCFVIASVGFFCFVLSYIWAEF